MDITEVGTTISSAIIDRTPGLGIPPILTGTVPASLEFRRRELVGQWSAMQAAIAAFADEARGTNIANLKAEHQTALTAARVARDKLVQAVNDIGGAKAPLAKASAALDAARLALAECERSRPRTADLPTSAEIATWQRELVASQTNVKACEREYVEASNIFAVVGGRQRDAEIAHTEAVEAEKGLRLQLANAGINMEYAELPGLVVDESATVEAA